MEAEASSLQAQQLQHLLAQVASHRDKQAFALLFKHFAPKIRAFGVQRLSQQGLALDLLQETMTTVWTKAHLFNGEKGAVSTWVFTIMRNQCFDMLRRVQHNREDAYGDDIWPLFEDSDNVDGFGDHMLSEKLLENMDKLPLLQRQVVQGVYLQELSQQELAERLGIPIGTVKSRLRLGLEKLRSYLEKHHD
ncbi:MAG: sigma-70 family RNA polymerase sigma factor [Shewanella sp.]|nr:sigma-70 family RNA polymerase sigma factor [Shewanella sp.]MCF1431709.1 sigma-70 family RNA polymerase sigma factor [Shewanella sp.]MCF1439915.1 sigma-70 family RNA polymerase sigma factor [Shewanella sp.]MCF1459197.1 sigma-70 family RNA polymerase sigma factor [Shewanella sp.]